MTMADDRAHTARCGNVIEHADLSASPCTGLLRFAPGDAQAQCDACGAWCGVGVADDISGLRARILETITSADHRAVVFHDFDEVPVGSAGYFTTAEGAMAFPSDALVLREKHGWLHGRQLIAPDPAWSFTSNRGPANDAKLAELIEQALVPEHGMLVSFRVEYDAESDWELGYEASWCDLTDATVLGHRLSDDELAHLHYSIEQFGGLQEGDAYARLDKQIEELGASADQRLRERDLSRLHLTD